jgi:hypothetical protein
MKINRISIKSNQDDAGPLYHRMVAGCVSYTSSTGSWRWPKGHHALIEFGNNPVDLGEVKRAMRLVNVPFESLELWTYDSRDNIVDVTREQWDATEEIEYNAKWGH